MDNNKKQALTAALSQIEKQFGKGAIMRMGDGSAQRNVDVVSSGSLAIDVALGIGGLPRGRIIVRIPTLSVLAREFTISLIPGPTLGQIWG